jgi:hypothetical protein
LKVVADVGLSKDAQLHAQSALQALGDRELQSSTAGRKHVMLSCELLSIALLTRKIEISYQLLTSYIMPGSHLDGWNQTSNQ